VNPNRNEEDDSDCVRSEARRFVVTLKQTESGLQSSIIEYIERAYGNALIIRINGGTGKTKTGKFVRFVRWWSRNVVVGEQSKGVCDLHVIFYGRVVAIECKVGNNIPSKEQLKYAEAVERAGGIYCLAYSLDDVVKCFDDLEARILFERDDLERLREIAIEFEGK